MKLKALGCAVAAGAAVVTAPAAVAEAAACTWTPSTLPLPAGASEGGVKVTDDQGGYAGTALFSEGAHVVTWKNGKVTDLGDQVSYGTVSAVEGENSAGTVVGYANGGGFPTPVHSYAFRSVGTKLEALPELPNTWLANALGIDDKGNIFGVNVTRSGSSAVQHIVEWPADRPGTVAEVTSFPKEHSTFVVDHDGSVLISGDGGPWIWRNGKATPLPKVPAATDVSANEISNGRVVGTATVNGTRVGVLWNADGSIVQLPKSTSADHVNRDGLIAGTTGTDYTDALWRLGQFEYAFPNSSYSTIIDAVADDGTVAGAYGKDKLKPTVWRCR